MDRLRLRLTRRAKFATRSQESESSHCALKPSSIAFPLPYKPSPRTHPQTSPSTPSSDPLPCLLSRFNARLNRQTTVHNSIQYRWIPIGESLAMLSHKSEI